VAGGKLTTYRLMAQQTVDRIGKHLGRQLAACRTAQEPLLEPQEVDGVSGLIPPPVSREVVEHYCTHEWAAHLDDVMLRRTSWHYYHRDSDSIARDVLAWMAQIGDWDEARQQSELQRYQRAAE
jgi:glycerol-3-phosphate dehydrogenase